MSVKDLINHDESVQLKATLRVFIGDEKLFGPGKLELLQLIQETGSISQAAKKMGLSYKKAWEMINSLNKHCKMPVVKTLTGGAKGGKSVLTPEGLELMQAFQILNRNFQRFLEEQLPRYLGI